MSHSLERRQFVQSAATGGALLGLGDFGFLDQLPKVSAQETKLKSNLVQLQPEIEPVVRLLEETPRGSLIETVAQQIQSGLSYRDLLASLLLAGVRNVQPRPAVGFKFHSVLVVNAAHLASLSSPQNQRWLPIFWALDYFKSTQAQDVKEGDWHMVPVKESLVPPPEKASAAFDEAMRTWDVEAADVAIAGLVRSRGAQEIYERLFRLGARDFRSIGHKAIFVANSYRTLQCIGWQHAEPVLRSLVYALLNHRGESNPLKSDHAADRPWRSNIKRAAQFRSDWTTGKPEDSATLDMLATLRTGTPEQASDQVLTLINKGIHPQSIWDGLLLGGGELLFRQRGIVALHALTTANALYYAWQATGNDNTRRMLLLQCAAFLPMFRDAMKSRGSVRNFPIESLSGSGFSSKQSEEQLAELYQNVSRDRDQAANQTFTALQQKKVGAKQIIDTGRLLIFNKGTNAHDYKFSSAVLEDFYHVSPQWRPHFLAAGVFNLRGSGDRDNALVGRIRSALDG